MKTIYKVLTPSLKGIADYMPSFPKNFVIQYEQDKYVCGRGNSKLFCFDNIESARLYITSLQKKKWFNGQKFMIWRGTGIGVAPKNTFISARHGNWVRFAELFENFWAGCRIKIGRSKRGDMFAAQKICIKELVEIV